MFNGIGTTLAIGSLAGVFGLATISGALPRLEILHFNQTCETALPKLKPYGDQRAIENKSADGITILNMNIQNLPITSGYKDDRMNCLDKLFTQYDFVALQEDFIDRPKTSHRQVWQPSFSRPAFADIGVTNQPGLTFMSQSAFTPIDAQPYDVCSGWVPKGGGDCWAQKGFLKAELKGVTFLTTHLDAGRVDHETRGKQLETFIGAIPDEGPVVVMGDFNLHRARGPDEVLLRDMITRKNLKIVMRYSPEKGLDMVLARGVDVQALGTIDSAALSDHAGIVFQVIPSLKKAQNLALNAK